MNKEKKKFPAPLCTMLVCFQILKNGGDVMLWFVARLQHPEKLVRCFFFFFFLTAWCLILTGAFQARFFTLSFTQVKKGKQATCFEYLKPP